MSIAVQCLIVVYITVGLCIFIGGLLGIYDEGKKEFNRERHAILLFFVSALWIFPFLLSALFGKKG